MTKPILKINWSAIDWITEGITAFILLGILAYTFLHYPTLPDSIPTHFDANGKADSFGHRSTLIFLVGASIGLYILFTTVSRFPHHFNYLVEITETNAHRHYTIALRMIRVLKLTVVVSFGYIITRTILIAQGKATTLGVWFLPGMVFLVFIPILFYIFQSKKI